MLFNSRCQKYCIVSFRQRRENAVSKKINLSELGENISLQIPAAEGKAEEVQTNGSEDGKLFNFNSLPPGYRFNPTDAEIIVFYLRKKVEHQPLPPKKIIEVNLYAYDPEELAGCLFLYSSSTGFLYSFLLLF